MPNMLNIVAVIRSLMPVAISLVFARAQHVQPAAAA